MPPRRRGRRNQRRIHCAFGKPFSNSNSAFHQGHAVERALFTFGLAPVGRTAEEVYSATYLRMEERNRRFYERYPQDVELVRDIVASLHEAPATMPRGGTLTVSRPPCSTLTLVNDAASDPVDVSSTVSCAPLPVTVRVPPAVATSLSLGMM